jgi:hypothetical protein
VAEAKSTEQGRGTIMSIFGTHRVAAMIMAGAVGGLLFGYRKELVFLKDYLLNLFVTLDNTLLTIAVGLCLLSFVWSLLRAQQIGTDARSYEDCVQDLRAMNTYNSYFISAIIVFLGVALDKGLEKLPKPVLMMLLAAFCFATFSMFFFPVQKPQAPTTVSSAIRMRWLLALIPTQWTVIMVTCAVINILLPHL